MGNLQTIYSAAMQKRRLKRWAGLGLLALLLLTLVGEGVARWSLGLGDPPLTLADPVVEYRFKPGSYHRFGNLVQYNAESMRSDPLPPDDPASPWLRVLCLGDSVLNGGSQTDQSELATRRLQDGLSRSLGRRVWVGNVSAGSWGPGNLLAYTRQRGWFDADAVVVVLSSHDAADVMTFAPVAGSRAFPTHAPWSALQEGYSRYLPRLWKGKAKTPTATPGTAPGSADPAPQLQRGDPAVQQGLAEFRQLLAEASADGRPVLFVQHAERRELEGGWLPGHAWMREVAGQQPGVELADLRAPLREAIAGGASPYRDPIHINARGQRVLADLVEPWLLNKLKATSAEAAERAEVAEEGPGVSAGSESAGEGGADEAR